LKQAIVGAGWCLKDLVFRVEGPVFEPEDELRVQHTWKKANLKVCSCCMFIISLPVSLPRGVNIRTLYKVTAIVLACVYDK
jgi:hypothetical protein